MTVTKLQASDAGPGYFYAVPNVPLGPQIVEVSSPELPMGTKYAASFALMDQSEGNFIVGWNWRQNDGQKWSWFDMSAYAGISMWVKADKLMAFNSFLLYDPSNILTTDGGGGTCTQEPCAPVPNGTPVVVRTTWTRVVQRFSEFVSGTPDLTKQGRVDLLQLRLGAGPGATVWITGVQLLKENELPPL